MTMQILVVAVIWLSKSPFDMKFVFQIVFNPKLWQHYDFPASSSVPSSSPLLQLSSQQGSLQYEVADIPPFSLQPGEIIPVTWKHNNKPVASSLYAIGLPKNFTLHMKNFANHRGITTMYQELLAHDILGSEQWFIFEAYQHLLNGKEELEQQQEQRPMQDNNDHDKHEHEEWFVQQYKSVEWLFNMHYMAGWNDMARRAFLREMGYGGFVT